ncbi:type IV pilus modification protein PilV [Gammaproteobacteria bacterium 50_400_T64]|nr:type IV pilus modification protein PilV [Gammaproteobacteria bacterium 50_400_T64]
MIKREPITHLQTGFTLIEVLVTVFVLAFGLLGFAALQTEGMKNNRVAELRTEVTQATYNIGDRIRANIGGAVSGDYRANVSPAVGYDCEASFAGTAVANRCSSTEMANADLVLWYATLADVLPSGTGEITCNGAGGGCPRGSLYTIEVTWEESTRTGFATKTFSLDIQP